MSENTQPLVSVAEQCATTVNPGDLEQIGSLFQDDLSFLELWCRTMTMGSGSFPTLVAADSMSASGRNAPLALTGQEQSFAPADEPARSWCAAPA